LPRGLPYTVFGVGGGEAVDLAIKVARGYTGRVKVISARGGYHGHTGLALAAGDEKWRAPFGPPAPGFFQVPFNDSQALEEAVDRDTAAIILETVPATYGMSMADEAYFPRSGGCAMNGECCSSWTSPGRPGRTGRLWGIEYFGTEPDIMVVGKGLSGRRLSHECHLFPGGV